MSRLQKFLTAVLPAAQASAMEQESRRWMMRCDHCGHEWSVWDAGGVRWKASGSPRRHMQCPQCGTKSWVALYKRETV